MVKVDIVRRFQLKENLSFGEAEKLVETLLEILKEKLELGEDVLISGFGKFEIKRKKSRPGRDPKTKKVISFLKEQWSLFLLQKFGERNSILRNSRIKLRSFLSDQRLFFWREAQT